MEVIEKKYLYICRRKKTNAHIVFFIILIIKNKENMKKIILFSSFLSLFLVNSCNETREEQVSQNEKTTTLSSTKKVKFKKETALLIGRILSNKSVRDEVLGEMKNVSRDAEVVSFGYLLKKENGIRKNEKSKIYARSAKKTSLFLDALNDELSNNTSDYSTIKEVIAEKSKAGVASRVPAEQIGDVLTGENLQLYSPYNEINGYSTTAYRTYYTSDEMVDGTPTNSGYYFNGYTETYIASMNNDLIDSKPSFIISEIDPCDLEGGVCDTVELTAATLPPPLTNQPTLLTYSVDHANIPDADIVSSRIPMIKVKGTSWMGFGGTHQKLRFFRGSYEGGMTQNADGTISVTGLKYQIGSDFRTKRRNVRKENWLTFDREFDPDWNQSEHTQQFVVFSLHKWRDEKSIDLSVKYGLKKNDKGGWEGTPEATGSAAVKFTSGSCIFRANSELPRRQVLSSITGVGSTGKVYNDGGVEYNVKSIGIVDYYYKHWYTDLQ